MTPFGLPLSSVTYGYTKSEVDTILTGYVTTGALTSALAPYATISYVGANFQPLDSDLTAISALTTTSFGRGLLTQSDATSARSYIGAQVAGSYQPLDSDLTALAALTTTSYGRGFNILADASAARTYINAQIAGTYTVPSDLTPYLLSATAATTYQPLDSDLTAIAAIATTSFGRSVLSLADATAGRTLFGSQVAGSYQPLDSDLTALAALATTSFGRGFNILADASASRTYINAQIAGTYTVPSDLTPYLLSATAASTYQPLDSDLTAIAALATTSFGRSVLTLADATAGRTLFNAQIAGSYATGTGSANGVNTGDQTFSLTVPSIFTSGGSSTTALSFTLNSQAANLVLASPNGSSGTPTFRALVAADIPSLSATYLTVTAATAGYQPLDSDLTAIAALTTTTVGRSLLAIADAQAGRTILGAAAQNYRIQTLTTATKNLTATEIYDWIAFNRTTAGVCTVNLPTKTALDAVAGIDGYSMVISDAKGDAATNNITLNAGTGTTILGAASKVINLNYGSLSITYNATLSMWMIS